MTQSASARPADSKESQQMTEFGRTLFSLMLQRGIEHRQTLLKELNSPPDEPKYSISQARLTYYLNGDRTVDPMFLVPILTRVGTRVQPLYFTGSIYRSLSTVCADLSRRAFYEAARGVL